MKVVRLSALHTGCILTPPPPGRLSQPWGHVAGRIVSMKNSNETIGIEPTTFWLVDLES